jgi:hypothetical protein
MWPFDRKQAPPALNSLEGKALRYLIGANSLAKGRDDEIVECPFDATRPPAKGLAIKYCNLFDEENTGKYGPYLRSSDTAKKYDEGQIDPRGPGWEKNLREQFERARSQGFTVVELDNPDAYSVEDVVGAVDLAASYGLKVVAKNPLLMEGDPTPYVAHPAVVGAIVEKDAGDPVGMEALRCKAGKPTLPVWFVAFGKGLSWAQKSAAAAKPFGNMRVTHSKRGEYGSSEDVTG